MTDREALDIDLAWRDLVIAGQRAHIERFLNEIDQRLPPTWERNTTAEQRPLMREGHLSGSRCYTRHTDGRSVHLWLLRRSDCRIDGGLVESTARATALQDAAEAIRDFRERVLAPAAGVSGLAISRNRLGPLSWVPSDVIESLGAFFDSSQFVWPPTGGALRRWREFVIRAYQTHAAFDLKELERWLVEKGWEKAKAEGLIAQLLSDAALLSEYEELRQPA